jgi:hypothetical protein
MGDAQYPIPSAPEISYLSGVSGAIQTQIDTKLAAAKILRSYLAATVTYNNVAALADTLLSVNVAASGIYKIELIVHSTSAVKGLLLDFDGSATIANFIGDWNCELAAGSFTKARVTAAGTDFGPAAADGNASPKYTFNGSVEITNAGTFLLRGAQNAADVSNTTILRGSALTLTKTN